MQNRSGGLLLGTRGYTGGDALSLPAQAEQLNHLNQVIVDAQASGGRLLINRLAEEYGAHQQEMVSLALDNFFEHRRTTDLQGYLTEHTLLLEEAREVGGLEMNDVGKSHFLMKGCGLTAKRLDDLKLIIGGDLSRYQQLFTLISRIAKSEADTTSSGLPSMAHYQEPDEPGWEEQTWWTEEDWYYDDSGDTYYDESAWYEDEYYDAEEGETEKSGPEGTYKGKTKKAKGKGTREGKGNGSRCNT